MFSLLGAEAIVLNLRNYRSLPSYSAETIRLIRDG